MIADPPTRTGGEGPMLLDRQTRARRNGGARVRQALFAFASCLRENGIPMPAPNTAPGNAPVFSTMGNQHLEREVQSRGAAKCHPVLVGALELRGAQAGACSPPTG
ncbi:MAG TPA: hypothetical protein VIC05_05105 [Solirubrobacteraceae bacterium]|jgi:hypothetical protein